MPGSAFIPTRSTSRQFFSRGHFRFSACRLAGTLVGHGEKSVMYPRFTFAAGALALVAAIPAFADDQATDTVVVTATRFNSSDLAVPANVSVISVDDIQTTPAANLPDLLAMRAGVDVRSLYGNGAANTVVDLRGFGENGNLRTLIMVDGRRIESLEMASINWNSIPLDSIERIEIVRGSSNVMHGDQATGGVINIITRRARSSSASVAVSAGSFGAHDLRVNASRGDTPVRYALSIDSSESDEYRSNNRQRGTSATGRLATDLASGEAFVDVGFSENYYELPGALTQAQYDHDPRASETSDSWFKRENYYVRPGAKWQIGADVEAAVELNVEQSHNRSWISNWFSYRDVQIQQLALTPRIRWAHGLGDWKSATVFGLDLSDTRLDQDRYTNPWVAKTNTISLQRKGSGFYVHNTTNPLETVAVTLGARQQRYQQQATDSSGASTLETTATKTAGELGVAWQASSNLKLFAKSTSTFRYPILDETTTLSGFASPAPRPESGRGTDIGAEWRVRGASVQATFYDLKMSDEIAYNAATYQNENLQKTEHRGVEIDARWQFARQWTLSASLNDKTARFSEGANSGKDIPLVPRQRWGLGLVWEGGSFGTHSLSATHVGKRYFGGDDANVLDALPAYTTVDWQSLWHVGAWEITGKVLNLTNLKYSPSGFNYSTAHYYAANPRSAFVSAKFNF